MGEYLKENNYVTEEVTGTLLTLYPNRTQFPSLAESIGEITG
jgi:hypothetical protein